jgi:DNA ligase-associated metallophosphoesterase
MNGRNVDIQGEKITVLPSRAAYWDKERTLFVADLHLGKAAAFRSAGVPIPHGTTAVDLGRLKALLDETRSARLVILGDFLHARDGRAEKTFDEVAAWRKTVAEINILVVRGNHDIRAGDPPAEWKMQCVDEPHCIGPFACMHHAKAERAEFVFEGHIHPKVRIGRAGAAGKDLPCFVLDKNRLLFPAFGSFTGGCRISRAPARKFFVIAGNDIFEA